MAQGLRIAGGVSNALADVNSRNQLLVASEVDAANHPEAIGGVKLFSENDSGSVVGAPYLKSPETDTDYRLRISEDTLIFEDTFNATAQNTDIWYYQFATMTAAQAGAGTVNFSTVQGTTSAHGAYMRTFQHFPLTNVAPLAVQFIGGLMTAPLVSGEVWLAGLGLPTAAVTIPTDGVYWRVTSAGVEGILKFNNAETSTGVLTEQPTVGNMGNWVLVIGEREVEFWAGDVLLGEIEIPSGNGQPFLGVSLPVFMQKYNTGAVSNTNQIRVAKCGVTLMGLDMSLDRGVSLSNMHRHAAIGQNGHTQGHTSGNFGTTVAIPATQAGSNTTPNAAMAGLSGIYQMTAQVSTAGTSGDMIAQYYLNPAHTINITGRNLVITSCRISCINYGAVIATTPTTLVWGIAYGHLSNTLAAVETASFATATTHAPRHIPLGMMYAPIGAVIGQNYDKEVWADFSAAPIVVRPGEYLSATVRFLVGTATASQTIVYTIAYNGYWE